MLKVENSLVFDIKMQLIEGCLAKLFNSGIGIWFYLILCTVRDDKKYISIYFHDVLIAVIISEY